MSRPWVIDRSRGGCLGLDLGGLPLRHRRSSCPTAAISARSSLGWSTSSVSPSPLRRVRSKPLSGERAFLDIGQAHTHHHLSQVDEAARGEVQRSSVAQRAIATRCAQDRTATQGMHALIGVEVRANGVVDIDRLDGNRAEAVAGGGGGLLVIGGPGGDGGGISQRGTFLRGSLDVVRQRVPVPPSKLHRRRIGARQHARHPEIYGRFVLSARSVPGRSGACGHRTVRIRSRGSVSRSVRSRMVASAAVRAQFPSNRQFGDPRARLPPSELTQRG